MRYLILTDIHANLEALETCLADAQSRGFDRTLVLGDLVGYGADPNAVIERVQQLEPWAIVRGNHDKVALGEEVLEWFNPVARFAALWTLKVLTPENLEYVRLLPQGPLAVDSYQIAHGSPLDEDEYLISAAEVGQAFQYLERDLTFFGHTHVQGGFVSTRRR